MKLIFLGSASAFTVGMQNFQSNVLIEYQSKHLLIDCGTDARHALYEAGFDGRQIDAVYCSHLHSDHVGGLEWLAQINYFASHPQKKLDLFIGSDLADDLWNKVLSGGLSSLEHEIANLNTFFQVHKIEKNSCFSWENIQFDLVPVTHVYSYHQLQPCYGLFIHYDDKKIWFTADLQFNYQSLKPYYETADIIFHDCETKQEKTGVHAHYSDLVQLPDSIKTKIWLYDYNQNTLPDARKDGFLGFVKKGQVFNF